MSIPDKIPVNLETQAPGTERTLAVLELISKQSEGISVTEICRQLGLSQNSVHRITVTLTDRGYLQRRADKSYVITGKLLQLAQPRVGDKSLAHCGFGAIQELRDVTGETAQLLVRANRRLVIIEQVYSPHPMKVVSEVGHSVDIYCSAPGKALLAFLPAEERDELINSLELCQYTPNTLTNRKDLDTELKWTLESGYGVDREEGMQGINCVGAPILNPQGYPIGALTIIGPIFRLTEDRFAAAGEAAIRAAAQVKAELFD